MTKYRYNTETHDLIEDHNNLGRSFYHDPWREATQQEVQGFLLQTRKHAKIEQLKANKDELRYGIVKFKTFEIYGTEPSRNNLFRATSLQQGTQQTLDWLNTNGDHVVLSVSEAMQIMTHLLERDKQLYFQEADLIKAINNATTMQELEDIDVTLHLNMPTL